MPAKKSGKSGAAYEVPNVLATFRLREHREHVFYGHGWQSVGWQKVDDDCQCPACKPNRVIDQDKQRRVERQRREREKKRRNKGEEDDRQAAEERQRVDAKRRNQAATRIQLWITRQLPAQRNWRAVRRALHGPPPRGIGSPLLDGGSDGAARRALVIGIDHYDDPRVPRPQGHVSDSVEIGRLLKSLGFTVEYCNTDTCDESRRPTKQNLQRMLTEWGQTPRNGIAVLFIACHGSVGSLVGYNPVREKQHAAVSADGVVLDARKRIALTLRTSMRQTADADTSVLRYLLPCDVSGGTPHHRASDVVVVDEVLRLVRCGDRVEMGGTSRPLHTRAVFIEASGFCPPPADPATPPSPPSGFGITATTVTAEATYDYAGARSPVRGLLSVGLSRALSTGAACTPHCGVTFTSVCRYLHNWFTTSPALGLKCVARDPWQRELPPPDLLQGPPTRHRRGRELQKRHAAGGPPQREQLREESVCLEPWRLCPQLPRRRLRGRRGSTPRLAASDEDPGHDLEFTTLVAPERAADFVARARVGGRDTDVRPSSVPALSLATRRRLSALPSGQGQSRRHAAVLSVRVSVPILTDTLVKEWEQEVVDTMQRLAPQCSRLQVGFTESVRSLIVMFPSYSDTLKRAKKLDPSLPAAGWEPLRDRVLELARDQCITFEAASQGQARFVVNVDTDTATQQLFETLCAAMDELAEAVDCAPAEQEVSLHVLGPMAAFTEIDEALRCGYANTLSLPEEEVDGGELPELSGGSRYRPTEVPIPQGTPRLLSISQGLRLLSACDDAMLAGAKRDKVFLLVVAVSSVSADAKARQIAEVAQAGRHYQHCGEFFYFEPAAGPHTEREARQLEQRSPQVAQLLKALRSCTQQTPQLFLCDVARRRNYTLSAPQLEIGPAAVSGLCDEHLRGGLQDLVPPVKGSKVIGWGTRSSKYILAG